MPDESQQLAAYEKEEVTATVEQKRLFFSKVGYEPSIPQWLVHSDTHRVRLVTGGERSGKSFLGGNEIAANFLEGELFWFVADSYELTHPDFQYAIDSLLKVKAIKPEHVSTPRVGPWTVERGGIKILSKSLQDILKIAAEAPDGIVLCEAGQAPWDAIPRLLARLAEKRGWILMLGTMESSLGWMGEKYNYYQVENPEGGKSFCMPSWSNLKIFPGGRNDPEIIRQENQHSKEYFMERFAGEPCPPSGLVFNDFRVSIHVQECPLQDAPIYLAIDPGYAGAYAVEFCQTQGDTVRVVDEVFEQGLVTEEIITACMKKPYWERVAGGAIDIAAGQHQAMPAVAEIWRKQSGLNLSYRKIRINEGIERLKTFLKINPITGRPNIYFDPKCKGIISEFGGTLNPFTKQVNVYRWKQGKGGEIVGEQPEDKYNHGIKAVIYYLFDQFGWSGMKTKVESFTYARY